MKYLVKLGIAVLCLAWTAAPGSAGWDPAAEQKAMVTIANFKAADPDLQIFFDKAYGYAVFPSIGKGAIGIGASYGEGTVFEQGVPIGATSLTKVSVGIQLGGQSYSEIIFFRDKDTLDRFKQGNFELDAEASAVAAKKGASAAADYNKGVAVFTMGEQGLMFEASVGGQKFTFEPKE